MRSRFAPTMNSKQTMPNRVLFAQSLRQMGEKDLLHVKWKVVERLNRLAQAKNREEQAQFAEGEPVQFHGQHLGGAGPDRHRGTRRLDDALDERLQDPQV